MTRFYELISESKIAPAPRPLRIDGEDVFTNDESLYNEYGYYRLERKPYPTDRSKQFQPYYSLNDNVLVQDWIEVQDE